MRSILIGLVLALAWAASASAAVTLRQDADGGASWVTAKGSMISTTPAGERHIQVQIPAIGTPSTVYVVVPFAGTLSRAVAYTHSAINTATESVTFFISDPSTSGGFFNQFTPATPAIAEAATGLYELSIPLAYAATGQISSVDWPANSNTSLQFGADSVIAIHTEGRSGNGGDIDLVDVIITVH